MPPTEQPDLDQPADPHVDMDFYEALERQKRGTLPELPALSAAEAVDSLLNRDAHGRGWRLCRLHCGCAERKLVDVGEELDEDVGAEEPEVVFCGETKKPLG